MDNRDRRPPRAARPGQPPSSQQPAPPYIDPQSYPSRPQALYPQTTEPTRGVSFQNVELGDRHGSTFDPNRQRTTKSPYVNADLEGADFTDPSKILRKKSLVRPDREKIEPGHRQWHYRTHVANLENEGPGRVGVLPSTTGNYPQREPLRRGRSLLGREEDVHESGLALFKRTTIRRPRRQPPTVTPTTPNPPPEAKRKSGCLGDIAPGPKGPWMTYCYLLTFYVPGFLFKSCGIRSPEQQRAWREKMGLISIILVLVAGVAFLTFGFNVSVCGKPPNRFHAGQIGNSSVIIHGFDYDFSRFKHPRTGTTFNGQTNPLLEGGWNLAGNDASFLFQKVNQHCLGLISKSPTSDISGRGNTLDWYFPCNIYNQFGTSGVNLSSYEDATNCHVGVATHALLGPLERGQVYYTWEDVSNPNRNLAVFGSSVLDLNLLQWLSRAQVNYPPIFDAMMKADGTYNGKDITMNLLRTNEHGLGHCLEDIVTVGFIDTNSIGCVASQVVLWLSLVFIVGVVAIRFVMAVMFQWFFSWKLGNFSQETYEQRKQRSAEIENWTNDIYRPAPSQYRPNVGKNGLSGKEKRKTFLPSYSRFTPNDNLKGGNQRPLTTYGMGASNADRRTTMYAPSAKGGKVTPDYSRQSRNILFNDSHSRGMFLDSPCPFPLHNVVPQPPPDYEPFNFPLAHTICLVTAYSESVEGLRTTLDALATTDYPNSHKLILVIADGVVKGAGNQLTTPEICLTMMRDFIIPPQDVEPHSYVAIADGHKRHNMAKVYAGFYAYDDATTERSKQQRVPVVLVAKCGNPLEVTDPKPGNRGKRDSQIVLMAFLQKVMFDERMTTFEYEFFNSVWRVTGVSPDRYELVLCVDADTKVFPDSLTRMVSCMVHDEEIMGLCGETKIANKAETFVTMMQVFEYYISHHMTKAFESMFGGVTCLPGCFSMYRIKAPKGDAGYWVPILANPDIVEHYSENVVDTLHKKNLLLLGEDRYLTTLMLKTFPKRKNMFCPQAVCKTIVPDTFRVLLSQRRRWINSTIHNLAELLFVRDLCGTFCFSMQFVVGMELAGTLVLPAAITFTLYLIIDSTLPQHTSTTIPLILLAMVLGLPGLLIVVTSRKLEYIGWMLVYLLSLPIWNGVLPAYAFWHFDDFSWGQTRQAHGDKSGNEGNKEGEFDSTDIIMKRWAEFERERRWKSGTHSRDSGSYERSNRYSLASDSGTYTNANTGGFDVNTLDSALYGVQRPRHDSNALLMLPAPLAAAPQAVNRLTSSTATVVGEPLRSSEEAYMPSDMGSGSRLKLIPTSQSIEQMTTESQESMASSSPPPPPPPPRSPFPYDPQSPRSSGITLTNYRNSPGSSQYHPEPYNPFRGSLPYDEPVSYPVEGEELPSTPTAMRGTARGVRLTDSGPVPGPEGVRRVSRPSSRRPTSQVPPQNRYSRPGSTYNLPPGAAPPPPGNYGPPPP